jgi:DNA-binding GntR family transcriptional regulator
MKGPMQPTSERLYLVVKRELLDGGFRPGERIDAAQLAERHFASITPVRAALQRLVGEKLVHARPSEGFHTPQVTEAGLRDLYAWNGHIALLAWRLAVDVSDANQTLARQGAIAPVEDAVGATEICFQDLGARSGNDGCLASVLALNDQLHLPRRQETELFADAADELRALKLALNQGRPGEVRRHIANYHHRRMRSADDIVRRLHRGPGAAG